MWKWLLDLVRNDRGQIGSEGGTADPVIDVDPSLGTVDPEPSATPGTKDPEEFFSLADFPDNVRELISPAWRRMQGAYTKQRQGAKTIEDKAALVDRFNSDREFTLQVIQEAAGNLGISLGQVGQTPANVPATPSAPKEMVEAVEATLAPEMKWMAPMLAVAAHAATKPLQKRQEADAQAMQDTEYDGASAALNDVAPGWEAHEGDMKGLLAFLMSGKQKHAQYGSRLEILYNIVTGRQHAVREAIKQTTAAARSRTSTSTAAGRATANLEERVLKAPTMKEAFKIAHQAAVEDIEAGGGRVPS